MARHKFTVGRAQVLVNATQVNACIYYGCSAQWLYVYGCS
jgi:hypothetical protein